MPVLPSCLVKPLWHQFAALLPEHVDTRPLGCYNPRIPDRIVFERVIAAVVHGSGYERIADRQCSDRTIRRPVKYWSQLGMAEQVHGLAVQAYDLMTGLQLHELSVDGCVTKAPCGGERAGRSPVDRGRQGLKHSVATEARGVPSDKTRAALEEPGFTGEIGRKGVPAPSRPARGGSWSAATHG